MSQETGGIARQPVWADEDISEAYLGVLQIICISGGSALAFADDPCPIVDAENVVFFPPNIDIDPLF